MQAKTSNTWIPNYHFCQDCFSKVVYFENKKGTHHYCSNISCYNHDLQKSDDWIIDASPENIKAIFKNVDIVFGKCPQDLGIEIEALKTHALAGDVNLIKVFHLWNKIEDKVEAYKNLFNLASASVELSKKMS